MAPKNVLHYRTFKMYVKNVYLLIVRRHNMKCDFTQYVSHTKNKIILTLPNIEQIDLILIDLMIVST